MIEKKSIKPPFPWFGGKSRCAGEVWKRFGNVPNYVEPFAGSLAVMLNRPHEPQTESVNDLDCYLANFWRALKCDPVGVAEWADSPVNEADLHARHLWLVGKEDFRKRMRSDPDFFDAKIAGWWVWGICQWIGSGWCAENCYYDATQRDAGDSFPRQQLPHMGDAGMGVHRPSHKLPHMGNAGMGGHRPSCSMLDYMQSLADRLRNVRVACGDWTRVLGDSVTVKHGITAVFLDPPYSHDLRDDNLYSVEGDISADVRKWAIENGENPLLRIALCGYVGEHEMPGWSMYAWKARGGYGSRVTGERTPIKKLFGFLPLAFLKLPGKMQVYLEMIKNDRETNHNHPHGIGPIDSWASTRGTSVQAGCQHHSHNPRPV